MEISLRPKEIYFLKLWKNRHGHAFQETFRILRSHAVDFPEENEAMAHKLQKEWESLYLGALYRSNSLESTKDQFRDMTIREIEDFSREIGDFIEKFHSEGPGSCGDDLDAGMEKMDVSLHLTFFMQSINWLSWCI